MSEESIRDYIDLNLLTGHAGIIFGSLIFADMASGIIIFSRVIDVFAAIACMSFGGFLIGVSLVFNTWRMEKIRKRMEDDDI